MSGALRFGIKTTPTNTSWEEMAQAWELAERLGFDTAYLFDHLMPPSGDMSATCYEGWTTLAALAVRTRRLRIGLLVTANPYRYPAVLAKMGATVDVISGGRLEFGIGAGWFEPDHLAYGIPFSGTAERIHRLEEACELIRKLWTQPLTNHKGRYYELVDARCEPKPLQRPHPPFILGGGGEQLTLRVVARQADAWNIFQITPEGFAHKSQLIDRYCEDISRDPFSIERQINAVLAIGSTEKAADSTLERIARRRGDDPQKVRSIMLAGTPAQVVEQIETYRRSGANHVVLSMQAPYELDQLEIFATEVIPAFRAVAATASPVK